MKMVKTDGNTITVTDGTAQIDVRAENLTNDLDLADLAARQDATSQDQLDRGLRAARSEYAAARDQRNQLVDQQTAESQWRKRRQNAASLAGTALSRGGYDEKKGVAHGPYIYYRSPSYYRPRP